MFLNLIAPCNNLGYGVVGYNLLKTMVSRGHRVSYFPIGSPTWAGDPLFNDLVQHTRGNAFFYEPTAPTVKVWHQYELDMFPGKGPRIGFPIFELNKFDDRELHHLKNLDKIFVPSEWAKNVIAENGINVPTSVVPFGVDTGTFFHDEEERKASYWSRHKTIFINVGKWEVRKGHDELLEAFCKAFKPSDDVELWMMNHNPFIGTENEVWKRKYVESPMGGNIRIYPRVNSQDEMRVIFNQVDCGVFPSKAEGWNLEILELMACGAQIIATNYSGHTEYLNNENAMLLETTGMESAKDGKWFHGQGEWCKFSVDQLVAMMRMVHEDKQKGALAYPNEAGQKTCKKFTWANSAKAMEAAL